MLSENRVHVKPEYNRYIDLKTEEVTLMNRENKIRK